MTRGFGLLQVQGQNSGKRKRRRQNGGRDWVGNKCGNQKQTNKQTHGAERGLIKKNNPIWRNHSRAWRGKNRGGAGREEELAMANNENGQKKREQVGQRSKTVPSGPMSRRSAVAPMSSGHHRDENGARSEFDRNANRNRVP